MSSTREKDGTGRVETFENIIESSVCSHSGEGFSKENGKIIPNSHGRRQEVIPGRTCRQYRKHYNVTSMMKCTNDRGSLSLGQSHSVTMTKSVVTHGLWVKSRTVVHRRLIYNQLTCLPMDLFSCS